MKIQNGLIIPTEPTNWSFKASDVLSFRCGNESQYAEVATIEFKILPQKDGLPVETLLWNFISIYPRDREYKKLLRLLSNPKEAPPKVNKKKSKSNTTSPYKYIKFADNNTSIKVFDDEEDEAGICIADIRKILLIDNTVEFHCAKDDGSSTSSSDYMAFWEFLTTSGAEMVYEELKQAFSKNEDITLQVDIVA